MRQIRLQAEEALCPGPGIRAWWLPVIGALVLGTGGCEKVRETVGNALKEQLSETVEKVASEQESGGGKSPINPVLEGLDQLRTAQEQRVGGTGTPEIRAIGSADFDTFVGREDRLVVIDFYADWCGPCRMLAPELEAACRELGGRVSLGKVNIDRERALATKWNVGSIPDVRIFRGGKQVDALVGAQPRQALLARLTPHYQQLPAVEEPAAEETPAAGEAVAEEPEGAIVPMEDDWKPPGIERR